MALDVAGNEVDGATVDEGNFVKRNCPDNGTGGEAARPRTRHVIRSTGIHLFRASAVRLQRHNLLGSHPPTPHHTKRVTMHFPPKMANNSPNRRKK